MSSNETTERERNENKNSQYRRAGTLAKRREKELPPNGTTHAHAHINTFIIIVFFPLSNQMIIRVISNFKALQRGRDRERANSGTSILLTHFCASNALPNECHLENVMQNLTVSLGQRHSRCDNIYLLFHLPFSVAPLSLAHFSNKFG